MDADLNRRILAAAQLDAALTRPNGHALPDTERGADASGDLRPHPLTKFVPCTAGTLLQPEFVIDGVIAAGFVLLAGGWGAGKTTQLVPLLMRATHLCAADDPLRPLLRRRVVYITEDAQQVRRVIASMRAAGELRGVDDATLDDWFKIVEAARMPAARIVEVAGEYARLATVNRHPRTGREYEAAAVVVFDTRSAVVELADENDNAEASATIAALRQGMPRNPVIVVAHLSKALKRAEVKDLTGRGAGAWEADAQQVLYIVKDDDAETRWLDVATPKHRFTALCDGVEFKAHRSIAQGEDQLGNVVDVHLIHGVPRLVGLGERSAARQQKAEERAAVRGTELRTALLNAAEEANASGKPLTRSLLVETVQGFKTDHKRTAVAELVAEGWLLEAQIPEGWRAVNNSRRAWIVRVNAAEREAYLASGALPAAALQPPPSIATKAGGSQA